MFSFVYNIFLRLDRIIRKILCCFIFSKTARHIVMNRRVLQYLNWKFIRNQLEQDNYKFKYNLSIILIIKNASQYMDEWINYHKLVGVDHFYIYDNESTDGLKEVLDPYIKTGLVTYIYWPGQKQQTPAYNDALVHYRKETKWMAFIDDDEFIVPIEKKTIPEVLKKIVMEYDKGNVAGVAIAWVTYGTSGHKKQIDGLCIERFKMRENAKKDFVYKTIVRSSRAYAVEPHLPELSDGMIIIDEVGGKVTHHIQGTHRDRIRINHYHMKSVEEFARKKARGDAYFGSYGKVDMKYIEDTDKACVIKDNIMDKYIEPVKAEIKKIKCKK